MEIKGKDQKSELDELIRKIGLDKVEKNAKSTTFHDQLMNSYGSVIKSRVYPDYYGGAYIDENDDYIINIVEDSTDWKDDLTLRIDVSKLRYRFVKYAYKDLQKVRDAAASMVNNNKDLFKDNIIGWGISNKNNKINVYAQDISEDKQKELLEKVEFPGMFQFRISGKVSQEATTIYAGSGIVGADQGSLAYRAKYGSKVGVITAAHIVKYQDYIRTLGGSDFAQCTYRQYVGPADAAFCQISDTSAYSPSNIIDGVGTTLSTVLSDPAEGSVVFKQAYAGSEESTTVGFVEDVDYSYYGTDAFDIMHSIYFTNMTTATYESTSGNSGGLIYRIAGANSTLYTVGVHHGRVTNAQGNSYAIYTKASNVRDTLNVTRY